jgi:hypothetical protein
MVLFISILGRSLGFREIDGRPLIGHVAHGVFLLLTCSRPAGLKQEFSIKTILIGSALTGPVASPPYNEAPHQL